jgi:serine-type D-Ala-D-Ala carboxypeptidase/endopeptidase (penicillin-binding protein 4)
VKTRWRPVVGSLLAVLLVVGCSSESADDVGDDPAALAPEQETDDAPAGDVDDDGDAADDGDPAAADADPEAEQEPEPGPAPPPPPPSRAALIADLQARVDAAVESAGEATLTVLVVDEHGRELVAHGPDVPVLPASTTKIVTAAAALLTLGEDRSLVTRAEVTGPIEAGGVVTGDLLLVGGGDPALATDEYIRWIYPARPATRLAALADEIVASGVRRISGDLVGVSEGFPGDRLPTGWPDEYFATLDARYIDGLTVDAGLRTIVTFPDAAPEDPDGTEDPQGTEGSADASETSEDGAVEGEAGEAVTVEEEAADPVEGAEDTTADTAADADADGTPEADEPVVFGPDDELPEPPDLAELEALRGSPRVIVDHTPDPPLHAAGELARMLRDRGIVLDGEVRAGAPIAEPIGRVARIASPTIEELLRFAVARSDNQMSDLLFRVVGRTRTGEGSWRESDRAIRQVLDRLGVDHDAARFADGSGLSRDSRVTARLLIDLDRAMQTTRHRARWMELMAVTGVRGTLSERLLGTPAVGRFYGKTGTLNDVLGLVGTVVDDSARAYHLAVLINDAPFGQRGVARSLQDDLILRLVADLDANAQPATEPALDETTEEPPVTDGAGTDAEVEPEAVLLDLEPGVLLGVGS